MSNSIAHKIAYRIKASDGSYLRAQLNSTSSLYELTTTNSANSATNFYLEDIHATNPFAGPKPATYARMYFFDGNVRYYMTPFSLLKPSYRDYTLAEEKDTVMYFTNSTATKMHHARVRLWPYEKYGALEREEDDETDILLSDNVYITFIHPLRGIGGQLHGITNARHTHVDSAWTSFRFELP